MANAETYNKFLAIDTPEAKRKVNKTTEENNNTVPKSPEDITLVRISRFHRELAKNCSKSHKGGVHINKFIGDVLELYCQENHPKLYQATVQIMKNL